MQGLPHSPQIRKIRSEDRDSEDRTKVAHLRSQVFPAQQ